MIYVSAGSELEEVQKAYNAGADEYLVTPYDPLVLGTKNRRVCCTRRLLTIKLRTVASLLELDTLAPT